MNDLSTNPMFLDTAAPYVPGAGVTQPAVLWRDWMKIDHFELVNYAAGAGKVVLKNRNGQVVCILSVTATDLEEKRTGGVGWIEGLVFDSNSTTGGQVLVYLSR